MSQYPYVPYGTTVHGQEEIDAVVHVLKTTTQMSKHVRELEEKVAQLYNKKYGIGVNSGSSALYLAADLLDYEEGTEIITPALTFSTTVAPIVKRKWIPAFVDVEEGTYNVDADKVEAMITPKTKAMIIPNLIGNLPDWKKLRAIADKHNLFVLEDSADTIGAEIDGASSGRYTDMSTTSFGMGQWFKYEDSAAFSHDKAITLFVKGSACFGGFVIATGLIASTFSKEQTVVFDNRDRFGTRPQSRQLICYQLFGNA